MSEPESKPFTCADVPGLVELIESFGHLLGFTRAALTAWPQGSPEANRLLALAAQCSVVTRQTVPCSADCGCARRQAAGEPVPDVCVRWAPYLNDVQSLARIF